MNTSLNASRRLLAWATVATICLHLAFDQNASAQQQQRQPTSRPRQAVQRATPPRGVGSDPHQVAEVTFNASNAHTWQGRAGSGLARQRYGSTPRLSQNASRIYDGNVGTPPMSEYVVEQDGPYDGEVVYEDGVVPHAGCSDCGDAACDVCDSCGSCESCAVDCPTCCRVSHCDTGCNDCVPLCLPRLRYLDVFVGVHGFKGPRDDGIRSNFGFQEGFNIAGRAPLLGRGGVAYQFGYQAVQSQLSGDLVSSTIRRQNFVTAGLFRRTGVGVQGGVVFDYLDDDYGLDNDFTQIRAEVSLLGPRCGEFGFWTALRVSDRKQVNTNVFSQPINQYAFFYRRHFEHCGEGRIWGGFTENRDGLVGGDFLVPLGSEASLSTSFNYLVPRLNDPPLGVQQEAWNLGISLVWYPRRDARSSHSSPYRPLFNVADNGTMFLDQSF